MPVFGNWASGTQTSLVNVDKVGAAGGEESSFLEIVKSWKLLWPKLK